MTRRAGLTLIELLVVLTILVALSGIALRSTIGLEEQARFEATQRTLEEVRAATIGLPSSRNEAGLPIVTGFVADVGRAPLKDALGASELWSRGALPSFGVYPATSTDPEVSLPFGWRGPYLLRKPGSDPTADVLVDGWNAPLQFLDGAGLPVTDGGLFARVRSAGGQTAPWNRELVIEVPAPSYEAHVVVRVTLTGTVSNSSGRRLHLRLFAPNPTAAEPLALAPTSDGNETVNAETVWRCDGSTTSYTWILSSQDFDAADLTHGARVVRAYLDDDTTPGPLDVSTYEKGDLRSVVLVGGNNPQVDVTLAVAP